MNRSRAARALGAERNASPVRLNDLDRIEAEIADALARRAGVRAQLALKRAIDVVVGAALLVVSAPLFLAAAVAVRLSSVGPIFHRATRWALDQRQFECLKFRSMRVGPHAGVDPAELARLARRGEIYKTRDDPRVTRVGAILRRTSIDELPQLLHVVRGEMSLVGPRPLVLPMLEPFPEFRRVRCRMRPGLTGLWQIRDREHATSIHAMVPHDLEYLRHFSLWLDLKILARTLPAVLSGSGAK